MAMLSWEIINAEPPNATVRYSNGSGIEVDVVIRPSMYVSIEAAVEANIPHDAFVAPEEVKVIVGQNGSVELPGP